MASTKPEAIQLLTTGAPSGSIIEGIQPLNRGTRLELISPINPGAYGGRPAEQFRILRLATEKPNYSKPIARAINDGAYTGTWTADNCMKLFALSDDAPKAHFFNLNNYKLAERPPEPIPAPTLKARKH